MDRSVGSVLMGAAVLLTACGQSVAPPGTSFVDSAGVRVALAESPAWQAGEGWIVSPDPLVQIGTLDGSDETLLSDVVGATRLSDGRIVVADRATSDLRFFDPRGDFLFRVGGPGSGPGEFRRLSFVGRLEGDVVIAYDEGLRRIQVFDPAGSFVRTVAVEPSEQTLIPDQVIGILRPGLLAIRMLDFSGEVPNGIVRWPPETVATVDLRSGSLHAVRAVPGAEASVERRPGGGYRHGAYVFGKGTEVAAVGDRLAVLDTEEYAVHLMGQDGATDLVIRKDVEPTATTQADLDQYLEGRLALVFPEGSNPDSEDVERFRQVTRDLPNAATLPAARSVRLDAEGHVWVEPYFHPGVSPPPYDVFGPEGTWLGPVALPPGLERGFIPYLAPSLEIGADYVLGVFKGELDVQFVRLYALERR